MIVELRYHQAQECTTTADDHQKFYTMSFYRCILLFGFLCGALGSLRPSDYALKGLEKFGADADDIMYSGLVGDICMTSFNELFFVGFF